MTEVHVRRSALIRIVTTLLGEEANYDPALLRHHIIALMVHLIIIAQGMAVASTAGPRIQPKGVRGIKGAGPAAPSAPSATSASARGGLKAGTASKKRAAAAASKSKVN